MTRKQFNETLRRLQKLESEMFALCDWYLDCNMLDEFGNALRLRREFSEQIDKLFETKIEC